MEDAVKSQSICVFLCKCVCGPQKVFGVQSLLHERQKKSFLPLAICMDFMVQTTKVICLSFLSWGGKSTLLFASVGNDTRLSAPIAVRPPRVPSAESLSSLVNKTAWKRKNLPSLRNSPDVSWLEVGTDCLRALVSRFSVSPAITAVFL